MQKTSTLSIILVLFLLQGFKPGEQTLKNAATGDEPGYRINAMHITDSLCYFATNSGLATYDGETWTFLDENPKVTTGPISDMDFELTTYGPEFWLGTNSGVNVASLPVDATSGATTYTKENTAELFPDDPGLVGDEILTVKVDGNQTRWYGTTEGLSAFRGQSWPEIDLGSYYSSTFFSDFPVTSIDYTNDTVYIGTMGGGVARMIAPADVDGISGASSYEMPWSTILSDNILSVFTDGHTQWFGSDQGVVKHTGIQAKQNWTPYNEESGLANNIVQCITKDGDGNMWFGTQGGVSKFDGQYFANYTTTEGLIDNNVLSIAVDADNVVWIGTENGLSYIEGSTVTSINKVEEPAESLGVYPNPAKKHITIELPKTVSKGDLRIINTSGSVVLAENNYQGQQLNISALESGLYFVQLNVGGNSLTAVFVKK